MFLLPKSKVFAVRNAAVDNFKNLVAVFGVEWTNAVLLPQILALAQDSSFLNRLTTLFAINALVTVCPPTLIQSFAPVVAGLYKDPIANIRFNVAKTAELLVPHLTASVFETELRPVLTTLTTDEDKDCQFFAARALDC